MGKGYQAILSIAVLMLMGIGASAQSAGRSGTTSRPSGAQPTVNSGDQLPHTIFVVGKVAMSDGSPPPGKATIVSMCGSNSRREAVTRLDGSFSFMLGDSSSSVTQDASNTTRPTDIYSGGNSGMTSNTPGSSPQVDTRTLSNCDLIADLQGYTSSRLGFPPMPTGTIDVGVLVLHSMGPKSDAVVSVTTLQAPSNAQKEFAKARAQLDKGKLDEAEASLRKAVEDYPQYAEAWYLLGRVQLQKKDTAAAHASFEAAQKADASYPPPYLHLAQAAAQAHQWQDALSLSDRLIALDPARYPTAYYYNAVANYNLDHLEAAETSALKAESLDKSRLEPRIEILLGMIYTARQNFSEAAQHYKNYLQIVPTGPLSAQVKSDLAKCEDMARVAGPPPTASKP